MRTRGSIVWSALLSLPEWSQRLVIGAVSSALTVVLMHLGVPTPNSLTPYTTAMACEHIRELAAAGVPEGYEIPTYCKE